MKTLFSTLALVFVMSLSFGQNTATIQSVKELEEVREKGKLSFVMPANFTAEEISNKSKYYTLYFTVDFNESTKVATVNMKNNDDRSRAIIVRFLTACEIKDIQVGNDKVNRDSFFEKYLK